MSEEIDAHVLRKYEVQQKLGKGVSTSSNLVLESRGGEFRLLSANRPAPQAYGIVWKAVDKKTREVVALKKIFDAFQNATDAQARQRGLEPPEPAARVSRTCARLSALGRGGATRQERCPENRESESSRFRSGALTAFLMSAENVS